MSREIRPARQTEAELLAGFQLALAFETEGLALDPATVSRGVQAVFDDPGKGEYWVAAELGAAGPGAEPQRSLVGCLLVTPEWSDWRGATVLWIQSVYVVPAARGRGVYRSLHERLRRHVLDSPDLCGLRLYVARENLAAQRIYERLGMSRDHYLLYEWFE